MTDLLGRSHMDIAGNSGNKLKLKQQSLANNMVNYKGQYTSSLFNNIGGGKGPASLTSQILYLITTLGKNLTRPFPGEAIKQGSGR